MPLVSVVMPAYNVEKYIEESIESILSQTFTDFEFIIINDASTDRTGEIIEAYAKKDSRIIYLVNEKNLNISKTVNRGIDIAKGKYIARMDADDISLPERIEKQVEFLEHNEDIGALGTGFFMFYGDDKTKGNAYERPEKNHDIKLYGITGTHFANPTVMMRKSLLNEYNLRYDSEFDGCEDFEFLQRMSHYTNFHNLREPLLLYRWHGENTSIRADELQQNLRLKIMYRGLKDIVKEDLFIPALDNPFDVSLNALKESFRVISEIPLMRLTDDCQFTRLEFNTVSQKIRDLLLRRIGA